MRLIPIKQDNYFIIKIKLVEEFKTMKLTPKRAKMKQNKKLEQMNKRMVRLKKRYFRVRDILNEMWDDMFICMRILVT